VENFIEKIDGNIKITQIDRYYLFR